MMMLYLEIHEFMMGTCAQIACRIAFRAYLNAVTTVSSDKIQIATEQSSEMAPVPKMEM